MHSYNETKQATSVLGIVIDIVEAPKMLIRHVTPISEANRPEQQNASALFYK
jgi:hypothetical protein